MKKILLMVVVAFGLSLGSNAQQLPGTKKLNATLDTLTNADTTTYTAINPRGDRTFTVYTKVTKISGTVGGTISVYASDDGGLTYYATALGTPDTITNTSGTKVYRQTFTRADQMYKIVIIGASGGVCSQTTWYYSN